MINKVRFHEILPFENNLFRPFLTKTTGRQANFFWTDSTGIYASTGGYHTQAVSYDGFTIYGGTFTGTVAVYGYNK